MFIAFVLSLHIVYHCLLFHLVDFLQTIAVTNGHHDKEEKMEEDDDSNQEVIFGKQILDSINISLRRLLTK